MACYHPIKAWQSSDPANRKLIFDNPGVLKDARGFTLYKELEIKCGQCIGCRLDHALDWTLRLQHENQMHQESFFLTLTYDDVNYPTDASLRVADMQGFFKRLRSRLDGISIRYFYCGEYGEETSRAHYHAIVFGWKPTDLQLLKKGARGSPPLYISEFVQSCWKLGYIVIGEVNFETCSYVARYVTKKMKGKEAESHYNGRIPEFCQMSRRPGIAAGYWDKYKNDILVGDSIVYGNGKKARPCRFYDRRYDMESPGDLQRIKEARKLAAQMEQAKRYGSGIAGENRRQKALEAREQITKSRQNLKKPKGI